jgi:hypothetical protein
LAITCFLIFQLFPVIYSTAGDGISGSSSDYGILLALDEMLEDKEDKLNSPEIENETQTRLQEMTLVPYDGDISGPSYQLKSSKPINPIDYEPIVFKSLEEDPLVDIINNTSILDLLFEQPLNYWIFTRSEGIDTWTKALLRPSLIFPKFNPTRWEHIDIDQDPINGDELRVRFDIVVNSSEFQRPTLLPFSPGGIQIEGGVGLTIERLSGNRTFPLELFIAKSISYEGENFIWNMGVKFDQTPMNYNAKLQAQSIKLAGLGENIISTLLSGGLQDVLNSTLAEINGPYSLRYEFDTDLKELDLMAGLVKYDNLTLSNRNWLIFYLRPAQGHEFVTKSGEVWVDSSNVQAPIDKLRWTAGIFDTSSTEKIPIDLRIRYGEERENYIFADVELIDLPKWFTIDIDYTKVVDGQNITVLKYSAADVLRVLNYTSYLFPDYSSPQKFKKYNCTHVLLEDVPTRYHMEMTTDIGRDINTTISRDPQTGVVANIIDNLLVRFANRFYRIGRYLKLAAEGILDLPQKEGWALVNAYDGRFTKVEFYQTSTDYIIPTQTPNYIAFYNTSANEETLQLENSSLNTTPSNTESNQFAISGRISGLRWANFSFGTPVELELRATTTGGLKGLFIDGSNYAQISFSNIPAYVKIVNFDDHSLYSTHDPEPPPGSENDVGEQIEQFEFASQYDQQFIRIQIKEIPSALEFNREKELIKFSSITGEYIGEINYIVSSDISQPIHQLETGNFVYILQNSEFITSAGRLTGLNGITYDTSEDGYFEMNMNKERPFHVMIIDNKTEHTKAKLIIDPLPKALKLELPGIVKQSSLAFPSSENNTGLSDLSSMVFALGQLGEDAINLLGNLSENLIESIGNIGFNFSISYELESFGGTLDIVAEIERGGIPAEEGSLGSPYATKTDEVLGDRVGWTHGICMVQNEFEGREILRGHLYLQGMPRAANLTTSFTDNTTKVDIDFKEYFPRHDWLLIDLRGIQDRDVTVFFQRIPAGVDFYAAVNLTTNLEIGGEMVGDVEINIFDTGFDFCTKKLGGLYVYMHTYTPIQSIREFMISTLPSELNVDFQLKRNIEFLYQASEEIDFIYTKLSKILTDSWHHLSLILHDLPVWVKFNFNSNTDFNIDEPLPLQGMPELKIATQRTSTLDLLISLDGAAVGQRGNIDLFIQDATDTSAKLEDNTYKIDSLGLDYLRIKITNLPLLDNYKLNSMMFEAADLTSLDFKVNLLFGVFPYFDLASTSDGKVEVNLDHTIKLFGTDMRAHVALIDIVYESAGGARVPVGSPVFFNSVNSDLTRTRDHLIIPAPLVSFFATWINNL